MRLGAGERSILASFTGRADAERAASAMREAGFSNVQVDRVSRFGRTPHDRQLNNPVAGQAATLTGLTLRAGQDDLAGNAGPLLAADAAVSGMSGPPVDHGGFLLTAVVSEREVDRVRRIVADHGGRL